MSRISILVTVVALCLPLALPGEGVTETGAEKLNKFYSTFVHVLKMRDRQDRNVAELVKNNPKLTVAVLDALRRKAALMQEGSNDFRFAYTRLQQALELAVNESSCSPETAETLYRRAINITPPQNRLFFLENIVRFCPEIAKTYYGPLADLYLAEGQFGMAVYMYKKALAAADDPDSRKLLKEAQERLAAFNADRVMSDEDLKMWLKAPLYGRLPSLNRPLGNRLYTYRVLFNDWCYDIGAEFQPQVDSVGVASKTLFVEHPCLCLQIEGHADERNVLERNVEVSLRRAEAVKAYLVTKFDLEPSRLLTMGYSWMRPFSPGHDEASWALNRRVQFRAVECPCSAVKASK